MTDPKHPFQSKTVWFGVALSTLAAVVAFLGDHSGLVQLLTTKEHFAAFSLFIGVASIVLRAVTTGPISLDPIDGPPVKPADDGGPGPGKQTK